MREARKKCRSIKGSLSSWSRSEYGRLLKLFTHLVGIITLQFCNNDDESITNFHLISPLSTRAAGDRTSRRLSMNFHALQHVHECFFGPSFDICGTMTLITATTRSSYPQGPHMARLNFKLQLHAAIYRRIPLQQVDVLLCKSQTTDLHRSRSDHHPAL